MLIGLSFGAGFLGPLLALKEKITGKSGEDADKPIEAE